MIPISNSNNSSTPVQVAPLDYQTDDLYSSQSSFAKLFQLVKKNNFVELQSAFSSLNRDDQCLVYEMVYQCAGSPHTPDLQWGENHTFDDMTVFLSAVPKAIELKYQRLTNSQKDLAHDNIYRLAGEPTPSYNGSEWGRLCAMNNLARLADAMAENKRFTMESIPPLNHVFYFTFKQALERFKTHPACQQLFQKNIFSTEMEMEAFYKSAISQGTCHSDAVELNKISDANPTWNRRQLLIAVKTEDVFYNQIIMFSKSKIGDVMSTGVHNTAEKKQLTSIVHCLQVLEPSREMLNSIDFSPNDKKKEYLRIYDEFTRVLKSKKNENNFHGMVRIKNIARSTGAGLKYVNHAIFFQHLKKESVFRFYDISTGFFEYFTQDEFLKKLRKVICDKYVTIADPSTTVYYSVDSNEFTYPCKSALGKLFQLAMQNKDQKEIEAAFSLLTRGEQCTIYGMVYQYFGEPATSEHQWGELHVFDNAEILKAAVTYGIIQRYEQSNAAKKLSIECEVARLDENYESYKNSTPLDVWGRIYAVKNLPRLADAMS